MCGIFGGYCNNLPKSFEEKAIQMLGHRGPDGSGFFQKGSYFLGHTRLAIQDTSSLGKQPLFSECGKAVITYNGELYNVNELRSELTGKGYTFKGSSDTEVLVNLYCEYGNDFLFKLNGIFAFAIYDLESNKLFMARDGFGVKPLYYSLYGDRLFFSSELKILLLDPLFNKTINMNSIVNHLTYLWNPYPNTMFEGIYKLEPGCALIFNSGKIEKKWHFDDESSSYHVEQMSVQDAKDATRFYLEQSVKRQMISDVPVGAFLSGGLDSSSIVHYAKLNSDNSIFNTFTIDTLDSDLRSDGNNPDLPYAKSFSNHVGATLNIATLNCNTIDNIEKMIYHLEEPLADMAPLNVLAISEIAASKNIKVLLSGAGGDDIFSGYRRHLALRFERSWSWLPKFLRKNLSTLAKLSPNSGHLIRRLSKAFRYADLDRDKRLISYFFWLDPILVSSLLSRNIESSADSYSAYSPLLDRLNEIDKDTDSLNKMLFIEQRHFLSDHNLAYTDKLGMACGVEIRVPFLDKDLALFASKLPLNYKQNGLHGKWILKKAMEGVIPKNIIYRAKTGFGGPLRYWMKNDLREYSNDLLSSKQFNDRGYFNQEGINSLRNMDFQGKVDASYSIFSLLCMEIWFRTFYDVDYSIQ